MPKTYTAVGTVAAGDVYTAAAHNIIATDINNFIVPPSCRLVRTTNQTITTSTDTIVSMGSSEYDTDSMGTTGASSRITINTTGLYVISMDARFTPVPAAFGVVIFIAKGAGTGTRLVDVRAATSATAAVYLSGSTVVSLSATDYLTPYVYQTRGSNLDLNVDSGLAASLTATWIGRTS